MTTLLHTLITFADNVSILALPPFEDFAGARPVIKVLFAMEMRLGVSCILASLKLRRGKFKHLRAKAIK